MKKVLSIFLFLFTNLYAEDFQLEKIIDGFERPWSLSFIDKQNLLVTEKPGNIKLINLKEKKIKDLKHNLKVLEDGQGGLLDILYEDKVIFVSYSEDRSNGMSSTSVARAKYNKENGVDKNRGYGGRDSLWYTPPGCWYSSAKKTYHFKYSTTSTRQCSKKRRCICKKRKFVVNYD